MLSFDNAKLRHTLTPLVYLIVAIGLNRIISVYLGKFMYLFVYLNGIETVYITSDDCMRRNHNWRIETAFPILSSVIKQDIIRILNIQLADNQKACLINEQLHNCFKTDNNPIKIRAQLAIYQYLKNKNQN